MWIFTKGGFVSAVANDTDPNLIRVRARKREHLVHSLGPVTVLELDKADYRFHTDVTRERFKDFLIEAVDDLNYVSHVKEEIAGDDNQMYRAMLSCWTALHQLQVGADSWAEDRWGEDDDGPYDWAENDDEPTNRPLTVAEAEVMFAATDEARAMREES